MQVYITNCLTKIRIFDISKPKGSISPSCKNDVNGVSQEDNPTTVPTHEVEFGV